VLGGPFAYLVLTWSHSLSPGRMVDTLASAAAEAARPKIFIHEVVLSAISDARRQSKLVVFETTVNADVTREENASSWGIYWGTNTARVTVRGARVQYVIDVGGLDTSNFHYDEAAKVLTVTVPKPRIDTSMVSIDPAKIQTVDLRGGWARFNKYETRDNAIAELKPKVINEAQAPFVQKMAADAGLETMTHFLQPLADNLTKEGATVKVVYQ
jgi:hypothetical protein